LVKLTVVYGRPDDPVAFEEYYVNTHLPLVEKVPNLQKFETARIIATKTIATKIVATPDGSEPNYYRISEYSFEDMDQLMSSLSTPEGQAPQNDIPTFATGGATMLIQEVDWSYEVDA
jgi:uncharacterized protein (TIGR02118 family)